MRIGTSTIIERRASDVWDLLGRRFGEASTWASSISASQAVGEPTITGAPCGGLAPVAWTLVVEWVSADRLIGIRDPDPAMPMDRLIRAAGTCGST